MAATVEPLTAPSSPAGPLADGEPPPPLAPLAGRSRLGTSMKVAVRQIEWMFGAHRRHGDVFRFPTIIHDEPVTVISHPDHVKSLIGAKPALAPSVTGESPLRPIVGSGSTLVAMGDRHMRQRKLLLPPFHGEAVARYEAMIAEAVERELDTWQPGDEIQIASRMQAVTLDVIMAGIFGVEGRPAPGTPEYELRRNVRQMADLSTRPVAQIGELLNAGKAEPVGLFKLVIAYLHRPLMAVIAARRAEAGADERTDILSLLLRATTEDGEALTDEELRDELLGLVLAGHETTANQLAWTVERLVRTPDAWERLKGDPDDAAYVDAVIHESQRSRPVIPAIGRRVTVPWRFGEHGVDAGGVVLVSILLLHHREDLYPDPFAFRPERFVGVKPGTYTWLPFGGGIRRCLGAALAMAEMRIVLAAIARRCELRAAQDAPEHAMHRNVTMIPDGNARVVVTARR